MRFPHQWSANAIAAPTKVGFGRATISLGRWGRWISSITAIVAKLWSRMARAREMRRMLRAWPSIDDRTLRDIGVSRLEMACAEVRQAPDDGSESHSALQPSNGSDFRRAGAVIVRRIC
jgi:uncharacterized protein YjiS (DUF1127 family)